MQLSRLEHISVGGKYGKLYYYISICPIATDWNYICSMHYYYEPNQTKVNYIFAMFGYCGDKLFENSQ